MVIEKLNLLNKEINNYLLDIEDDLLSNFTNEVLNSSNFSDVDKIIKFINEPFSTWKNNIIYKLSASFNKIKYKNIPLLRYVFIESYKLMSKDADKYNIERSKQLFMSDIYYWLMRYNWNNEKIKTLKYYLVILNIIWMIDFKWSNIYFLIQSNYHDEYYNQLLYYLINRFLEKIYNTDYYWYSVRIIYSSYIYWDIMEYKFKNYNTLVNNIAVYKLLHKIYINNKWADQDTLKKILYEWLSTDKHISKSYISDESINKLMWLLNKPYSSEIEVLQIVNYNWDNPTENKWGISEDIIEKITCSEKDEYYWTIEDIITLLWWDYNDPHFYLLYDIFYNKINTFVLYQLKEFEELYKLINNVLDILFCITTEENKYKLKLLLNNINYIEQSKLISQKKLKYSEEFKMIRSYF